MNFNYILDDDHNPVPCEDIYEWGRWMERARKSGGRIVGQDNVPGGRVSTVFLGIDHGFNFIPGSPPVLFETMVFPDDSSCEDYCRRYSTWDEAVAGHNETLNYYAVAGVTAPPPDEAGEVPPPPPEPPKYVSDGKPPKRRLKTGRNK